MLRMQRHLPLLALLVPGLLLFWSPPPVDAADAAVAKQVAVLKKFSRDSFEQKKRQSAIRALGKIGGLEAAAALVPLLEDPKEYVHLRDHVVSAWIAMMKGPQAAESQTWISGRALGHRAPEVRRSAAVALGLTSGAEIEEPLRVAIAKEKDALVLAALAEAAMRLRGEPELRGALLDRLTHKDGRAVFQVALAAAAFDGQAAVKPLQRVLKHRAPLARAGAVLALQTLDALSAAQLDAVLADKAIEPRMALAESLELRTKVCPWPGRGQQVLERLLSTSSWRVRAAAVQGALRVWENGLVDLLIDRLAKEDGRLGDDVRRALETYTGKTLGSDPDLWRAWWIRWHTEFKPTERPKKDRAGNIRFREAHGSADEGASGTVAFFNLPLRSKRLAFVFDLSGSMKDAAHENGDDDLTKIELLQREVEKTLAQLGADTSLDLFVYRYWSGYPPKTKLTRALGKLQPASKANIRRAGAWLKSQQPKGWGAFFEPLEAVLKEDVDTVILLSDGRPSRGRYDRDFRLLAEFPLANRFRRLAVHTVLVGTKAADRKFMEALAAATGGRFQEAKP
jgi:HEAT repeat protein